jgi:hypothetical protein
MRAIVVHDRNGNIAGLAISPPDAPLLFPTPAPGQLVTEVDLPEDGVDLSSEQRAIETLKGFRVYLKTEAKLVRKTSPESG